MMHNFICGCQMPTTDRLKGDRELTTLDTVSWDDEGFLVCKVHGQRMNGWRVPAHKPLPVGMAGATDLEWQAWVLYGEKPKREGFSEITVVSHEWHSTMRDSRDPVQDFDTIMADVEIDRATHPANGHAKLNAALSDGHSQMRYQRELATAQVISRTSTELAKRENGF